MEEEITFSGQIKPPTQLVAWHEAWLAGSKEVFRFAANQTEDAIADPYEFLGSPELRAAGVAIGAIAEKLGSQTKATLHNHGCDIEV